MVPFTKRLKRSLRVESLHRGASRGRLVRLEFFDASDGCSGEHIDALGSKDFFGQTFS
jgi:hypothetical protein